jgi:hypothetical protein
VAHGSDARGRPHAALHLSPDAGPVWRLRRVGGPAFGDVALAALVGHRIRATARLREPNLLLLERWSCCHRRERLRA